MKTSHSNWHGLRNGYRSGLEEAVSAQLKASGVSYLYEDEVIFYKKPESIHKYTPDFVLIRGGNSRPVYIETKGYFTPADRKKHLFIQKEHPQLDLRFVFENPNNKISKKSKTTYAMWCDKHGFKYATKWVPKEWLNEISS